MAVDNIARGMAAKALENQGGGGSSLPIVNTAAIGQTIRVSAVDEDGKPTEWEAVEFPAGGGGSGEWELVGEITSDGTGGASGLCVPIDFTQYKTVYIEAYMQANVLNRVMMSSGTQWYNGASLVTNSKSFSGISAGDDPSSENVLTQTFIHNVCGELKPFSCFNSGYSSGFKEMTPLTSPRYTWREEESTYIRLDTNNNGAVAEGNWLKVWGCK